jgi:hypothetical protein
MATGRVVFSRSPRQKVQPVGDTKKAPSKARPRTNGLDRQTAVQRAATSVVLRPVRHLHPRHSRHRSACQGAIACSPHRHGWSEQRPGGHKPASRPKPLHGGEAPSDTTIIVWVSLKPRSALCCSGRDEARTDASSGDDTRATPETLGLPESLDAIDFPGWYALRSWREGMRSARALSRRYGLTGIGVPMRSARIRGFLAKRQAREVHALTLPFPPCHSAARAMGLFGCMTQLA